MARNALMPQQRWNGPIGDPTATALFLGENAANADHEKLAMAKAMAEQGADRNDILKRTGWYSEDGRWEFESDDSQFDPGDMSWLSTARGELDRAKRSRWRHAPPELGDKARGVLAESKAHLPNLWASRAYAKKEGEKTDAYGWPMGRPMAERAPHQQLFAAYPETRNTPVTAAFPPDWDDAHAVYVVPETEGDFAGVAVSPEMARYDRGDRAGLLVHEYQHLADDKARVLSGIMDTDSPYLRRRAELRAFNAQVRRTMTPEQRLQTPPWATMEREVPALLRETYGDRYNNLLTEK